MFPDLSGFIKTMFALSVVGIVAALAGGVALIVWLFTHVRIGVS